MGTKDRRTRVLKAIVRDYVSAREPVGSRSLVERYDLGVSPATIRNDMAALEEAGLIHQPHTSAGRIPTDQGYRHFVDSLDAVKPLSAPERRAIERVLSGAVDLDDVIARAVRALAQITQQAAVVQYPSLQRVSLRHIELIPSGAGASSWSSSPRPAASNSGPSPWPATWTPRTWPRSAGASTPS